MNAAVLPGALQGLSVLAVEDEALVAMCLEDILLDLGCAVLGPAARVHQALKLLDTEHVDIAVLDVNVAGEVVFPVADKLKALGVPFIFATAYGVAGVIAIHREADRAAEALHLRQPASCTRAMPVPVTAMMRSMLQRCLPRIGRSQCETERRIHTER